MFGLLQYLGYSEYPVRPARIRPDGKSRAELGWELRVPGPARLPLWRPEGGEKEKLPLPMGPFPLELKLDPVAPVYGNFFLESTFKDQSDPTAQLA